MPTLPWEIAAKTLLYAAVLAAIGACAIRSLLLPRLTLPADEILGIADALNPVRTGAAAVVLVALLARVCAHTVAVFDWPDALSWDSVRLVAIESQWGAGWQIQTAVAAVFFAASVWAGRARAMRPASGHVTTLFCVALIYSMPLVGHGASAWWRIGLHGTHILGAGVWAGVLMALVLIRVPASQRLTLLRALSPLALSGAAVLGLAGVAMTWLYIGSVSNLWTTPYGQLLTLKLAFVGGIAVCGALNWRRFSAERRGAAHRERVGVLAIEIVFAALVVVVTAALTEVGHP